MSARYDITADNLRSLEFRVLHAGDDYNHQFTAQRGGSILILTGAKLWFTIKDASIDTDAQAQLQLTTDASPDEIEITDGANGIFVVKFVGTGGKSTADLEGEWQYDIQALLASGALITLARGVIEFLPDITRTTS